jgi:hypothetical protein
MPRAVTLAASLLALTVPICAIASDLGYVGQPGSPAEQAAEMMRARTQGIDRSVALATIFAVVDAVKSGTVADGLVPAAINGDAADDTTNVLLGELDPGIRVVGEARVMGQQQGATAYWMIARSPGRLIEQHPDRLVVNVEAPAGSKAFSLVVAGLSKVGFTVTSVASAPQPGKQFGHRYLLALAADKPILALRASDAIARDSRAGEGRAALIGAWKQVP